MAVTDSIWSRSGLSSFPAIAHGSRPRFGCSGQLAPIWAAALVDAALIVLGRPTPGSNPFRQMPLGLHHQSLPIEPLLMT